ncbi:TonB-dependent siderophore receptor [Roseateles sp. L2-2]|uniref:TonB-dependent siderophore receptor n=1 Tax=Roseateles sp. L2-2 TaxID=3422597 RepID=UPI003D360D3C
MTARRLSAAPASSASASSASASSKTLFKRSPLSAASLAACFALPLVPAAVLAQQGVGGAAASAASGARSFNIPPGPLDLALNRLARSAGVLLSFDPKLVEGRQSAGLNGTYTVDAGLRSLLGDTSLKAVAQSDGSFVVERATPDESAAMPSGTLPAVRIKARTGLPASETTDRYGAPASSTATRLALSPRETPQSVTVVTRARMDDFGLLNANDVLASTTGVSVDVVETDRTYFNARGFDISNFQIDGVGMPFTNGDQLGDIDTALYDRVEVLRGANGLLSSTGNPAATVNYVRKRPTADFQASFGLTLGSWDKKRAEGDISGPLNESGTLRGRAIVMAQRNESFMDNYALTKNLAAGLLEASLAPRTTLTLGVSRQANRPEGTAWGGLPLNYADGSPTDYPRSTAAAPRWSHWDNTDTTGFVELAHALGNGWTAKGMASYRKLSADGKLFSISGALPDRATGAGTESWLSTQVTDETQKLVDVSASGPFELLGRRHDAVVGINTARVHNEASYQRGAGNGTAITAPDGWGSYPEPAWDGGTGSADFVNRRESIYAMTRLNLADPWKLLLGLNHTRMRSEGMGFRAVPRVYKEAETVPYVGTVVDIDAHHSLYASYTKIVNPQTQVDARQALLGPITGSNVEAGAKGEWLNGELNGSVAVFRTKQNNLAEYAGFDTDGGFSYYRRIDAASTGFELEMAGRLSPDWDLTAGYTQLRIEDAAGADARTFIPRRTARVSARYRVPALPQLKLGATLRWQSDIHRINGTQTAPDGADIVARQSGYAVLGLMARYDFSDRLSGHLLINNVTDRKYLASLYWDQSLYGAGRNGQVTLNWKL